MSNGNSSPRNYPVKTVIDMYHETHVDPSFQREWCWSKKDRREFVETVANKENVGSIKLATVSTIPLYDPSMTERDREYCIPLVEDHNINFVSLDGLHRMRALHYFVEDDLFGIDITMPSGRTYTNRQKFSEWDEDDQLMFKYHCTVLVETVDGLSRSKQSKVFANCNNGSSLSNQEHRNSFGDWETTHKLREMGEIYKDMFKAHKKRKHEETIMFMMMTLVQSPENLSLTKKSGHSFIEDAYPDELWEEVEGLIRHIKVYMDTNGIRKLNRSTFINFTLLYKLMKIHGIGTTDYVELFTNFYDWCRAEIRDTSGQIDGLANRNGGHGHIPMFSRFNIFGRYLEENKIELLERDLLRVKNNRGEGYNTPETRYALCQRDNFTCIYSGIIFTRNAYIEDTDEYNSLEVDHIIPLSRGGTNHIDNLQLILKEHNRAKGTMTDEEYRQKLLQNAA